MKRSTNAYCIFFLLTLLTLSYFSCSKNVSNPVRGILETLSLDNRWTKTSEIRTFTAENLWEFIDGAAEQFVLYGVKTVATTDIENKGEKAEFSIELYEMPNALNAFGVYSLERNPVGSFLEVGTEGCWNGTSLFFYKNKYYAKIVGFEENKQLEQSVKYIAERLSAAIPDSVEVPSSLSLLPHEGLKKHSEKYYTKNVLAQPYFSNGYTAEYTIGKVNCLLFFVLCSDAQEATQDYISYKKYIETNGNKPLSNVTIGEEGFSGTDSFYKKVLAFHQGSTVGGVLGDYDENAAKKIIEQLITSLNNRK